MDKRLLSSWSSEEIVAQSFSNAGYNGNSVILECVDNITGVGVQNISKFGVREAEVLSNAEYEVVSVKYESKYDYITKHNELIQYDGYLEEREDDFKEMVVCRILVKEQFKS